MKISGFSYFFVLVNKMYIDNRVHIRHIMLYNYQKEWKAAQPFSDLNEPFGEGIISESKCREWFAHFKSDSTSLNDESRRCSSNFKD